MLLLEELCGELDGEGDCDQKGREDSGGGEGGRVVLASPRAPGGAGAGLGGAAGQVGGGPGKNTGSSQEMQSHRNQDHC